MLFTCLNEDGAEAPQSIAITLAGEIFKLCKSNIYEETGITYKHALYLNVHECLSADSIQALR